MLRILIQNTKFKKPLSTVFSFETCPPMICSALLGWLSLAVVCLGISKHSGHMPKQEGFLCLAVREKKTCRQIC